MPRNRSRLRELLTVTALVAALPAGAQGLPTPIFRKADPQIIYVGSPGWLDAEGRIIIHLSGENLAPNDGMDHPTGHDGGYQHLFIRGISPKADRVTPWVPAVWENGARIQGGMNTSVIILAVNPARYLSEPGSHLQLRLWTSLGPVIAEDPSQATAPSSGWSGTTMLDVAPAGAVKPVEAPPAPKPTAISRIVPDTFTLMSSHDFRIKIYGTFGTGACKVIFAGDSANPVPSEDASVGYEMNPTWTSTSPDNVFHVTIPEKYRLAKPGQLKVVVLDGAGRFTPEKAITFNALTAQTTGRPEVSGPAKAQVVTPTLTHPVNPVVLPKPLRIPPVPVIPPEVLSKGPRLAGHLPQGVRPRLDLVRSQFLRTALTPDPLGAARSAVRAQFPTALPQDIEALVALVMMDIAKAADQELRDEMDAMEKVNKAKQAQRESLTKLQEQKQRVAEKDKGAFTTLKPTSRLGTMTVRPSLNSRATPLLGLSVPRLSPSLLSPPSLPANTTTAQLDEAIALAQGNVDSLSELSESESLKLQVAVDRMTKAMEALSNLMKQMNDTDATLLKNLK